MAIKKATKSGSRTGKKKESSLQKRKPKAKEAKKSPGLNPITLKSLPNIQENNKPESKKKKEFSIWKTLLAVWILLLIAILTTSCAKQEIHRIAIEPISVPQTPVTYRDLVNQYFFLVNEINKQNCLIKSYEE